MVLKRFGMNTGVRAGIAGGVQGAAGAGNPTTIPVMYNPYAGTGTFTVLADSQIARLYHSNAFLLIDGTVSCQTAWPSLEENWAA